MSKLRHFVTGIIFFWCIPLHAQDTVRIKHTNYETVFSKSLRYPVLVEWTTSIEELRCQLAAKRTDKFSSDPLLPEESNLENDYRGSGFDRGHIAPAGDSRCRQRDMDESFYYTNMAPQYPGLNRGQWKNLEDWTRILSVENNSVTVKAGCVGEQRRINRVAVPTHCWKVIKTKNEIEAYVFPNVPQKSASFSMHKVPLDSVRKLTGFIF